MPWISLPDELVEASRLTLGPGLGCKSHDINRSKEITQTIQRNIMSTKYWLKVRNKAKIKNRYNQIPHLTQDTIWESEKTQENITYKEAKRSVLFQQVATRLQGTDTTV